MALIKVIESKCTGCGLCVEVCSYDAIDIENKIASINPDRCTFCGACVEICKLNAIEIENNFGRKGFDLTDYRGVWVFCEQKKGIVQPVVYELLGVGRKLADKLDVKLSAVLLGSDVSGTESDLFQKGADVVYLADNPRLEKFHDDSYAKVILNLVSIYRPEIILAGATAIGRALMPRVATKLSTGLTADCTGLDIDEERNLLQTRPAYGGNIMATILCKDRRPQMATVRHKVMKENERDKNRKGKLINVDVSDDLLKSGMKILDVVNEIEDKVSLAEADIIVAGGRGLQRGDNFKLLKEFADLIGGAVGATRGAVDKGWISYAHQVGQTGQTVCPKVYIAIGVSGMVQHIVGMQSSDLIVAINKDPHAPIFKVADYGLVGDLFDIVPKLIKGLKN